MEKKEEYPNCSSAEVDNTNSPKDEIHEVLQTLEQQTNWDGSPLFKYNGYWFPQHFFRPILSFQKHFKAKDSDIILASSPKSGTTWLKALAFSIVNRNVYPNDQSPLLTCNPHALVPSLERHLYSLQENPDLEHIPNPRIFSTHMPFSSIRPDSIRDSECKTIYGIHPYGPFWDHILESWNAHLKNPEKALFLKYEDLKQDTTFHIKKIAEFLGCPFSLEEEKQGLIEQIAKLCSFENLKNLEVNKTGKIRGVLKNSSFFRKEKLEIGAII
ncbi:hypothetical protein DH2020_049378 [Rehmannia glutinosa]|uniref:Sulfotransferase n=1 Tax=Rehmannia glutinosa TaxID=99300 RepID=A0ABR0U318_REHGL